MNKTRQNLIMLWKLCHSMRKSKDSRGRFLALPLFKNTWVGRDPPILQLFLEAKRLLVPVRKGVCVGGINVTYSTSNRRN